LIALLPNVGFSTDEAAFTVVDVAPARTIRVSMFRR